MEENFLKNYGMVVLDSSELMMVRGGISIGGIRRLIELALALAKAVEDYLGDFISGLNEGWDMID